MVRRSKYGDGSTLVGLSLRQRRRELVTRNYCLESLNLGKLNQTFPRHATWHVTHRVPSFNFFLGQSLKLDRYVVCARLDLILTVSYLSKLVVGIRSEGL